MGFLRRLSEAAGARRRPDLPVDRGERLLAWGETDDGGVVGGTREALYARTSTDAAGETLPVRIGWEQVDAADWDAEEGTLVVRRTGTWGEPVVEHRWSMPESALLLQLVRERVTATIVHQRHVTVHRRKGFRVVGRRAPAGRREVQWYVDYDTGVHPDDPAVREAVAEALAAARELVGLDFDQA